VGGMPYPQLKERIPRLLRDAREGVIRVKRIVGDLKDFAGVHPTHTKSDVDLNVIVGKAVGLVGNMVKKTTSDFKANYAADLPRFNGNGQRIEQVAVNLLVNACQAAGSERPMSLEVTTGHHAESGEIFLKVKDTGTGMAPDVIERITDPFFTTKRDAGGTGLGLSISHTIVKDHGGRMAFESAPGHGTTVTVYLPVKEEKDHQEESHGAIQ
jgi:two-component system, NtrC family, sensor kinase